MLNIVKVYEIHSENQHLAWRLVYFLGDFSNKQIYNTKNIEKGTSHQARCWFSEWLLICTWILRKTRAMLVMTCHEDRKRCRYVRCDEGQEPGSQHCSLVSPLHSLSSPAPDTGHRVNEYSLYPLFQTARPSLYVVLQLPAASSRKL